MFYSVDMFNNYVANYLNQKNIKIMEGDIGIDFN